MAFIVVMNHVPQEIKFLEVTDEMAAEIENKYDNDVESWMSDKSVERTFHFHLSDCSYMYCEEMPEIFGCYPANSEEIYLHLCQ